MQTQNVQRSFVDRMREEFKHDLSLLSQSAQHINKYSCSLHITRTMSQLTIQYNKSVCVQLSTQADNVALPAFARCTLLLLSAGPQYSNRSISPARCNPRQQVCSSGFAAVGPCLDRRTEKRTDIVPLHAL